MRREVIVHYRVGRLQYTISVSDDVSVADLLERINTNLNGRDLRWVYRGFQRLGNDTIVWDNYAEGDVLDIFADFSRRRSITACPAMGSLPTLRPLAVGRRNSLVAA
jgi:hypothetical protein